MHALHQRAEIGAGLAATQLRDQFRRDLDQIHRQHMQHAVLVRRAAIPAQAEAHAMAEQAGAQRMDGFQLQPDLVGVDLDHQRLADLRGAADQVRQPLAVTGIAQRFDRLVDEQRDRARDRQARGRHVQRVVQHPAVEFGQALLFAQQRQQLAGGVGGAIRMVQSQQGLVLGLFAALQRDDGLVVHIQQAQRHGIGDQRQQFVADLRLAGRGLAAASGGCDGCAGGGGHRTGRAAGRVFGIVEHRGGVGEGMAQVGGTDRHFQCHRLLGCVEGVEADRIAQLVGVGLQLQRIGLGIEHQEAGIAITAGHRALAQLPDNELCGILQQLLDRGQAHALAQRRHVLDADEQQAAIALRDIRLHQRLFQPLQHRSAEVQASAAVEWFRARHLGGTLAHRARAPDPVGDGGDQVFGPDRLGQEIVAAGAERLVVFVLVALTGQKHDGRMQEFVTFADQRGQLGAVAIGHVQVHQHQIRLETLHCLHDLEPVLHHFGFHAGIAQDGFGEQALGRIVLDHEDAEARIGRVVQQGFDARDHLVRSLRIEQQCIGAGTACGQARGHGVGPAQHQQPDRVAGTHPRGTQHGADAFQFVLELGIDQDDVGRQRAEHFLQFLGVFQQFQFVAELFQALVELDRQLAAFGQVVDALAGARYQFGFECCGRRWCWRRGWRRGAGCRYRWHFVSGGRWRSGGCADASGCGRNGRFDLACGCRCWWRCRDGCDGCGYGRWR